jgi:hypothetical protein
MGNTDIFKMMCLSGLILTAHCCSKLSPCNVIDKNYYMKLFKLQHLFFATLALLILTALSCKKNDNSSSVKSMDAIVINTGPQAADGCGWLIKAANDSIYNATNLTSQYQVDSLKVHITYRKLAPRFYCGNIVRTLNPGITEIQLNTITKR